MTADTDIETPDIKPIKPVKVKPAKRAKATDTKKFYVTNAQLLEGFHASKAAGKLTNEMAKYLMMVAEKYSYHPWFAGYSFREDMVCTAVVNLCVNWHKFDPNKSESPNPFSYYTTSCYRSFLSYIDAERRERDIRDELLVEAGANPSFNYAAKHGTSGKTSDDTAFSSSSDD